MKRLLLCCAFGLPAAGFADEGGDVYRQACAVCHAVGVAGAPGTPRLGVRQDWAERLVAGRPEMLRSVLKGKGAMPPKGGDASLSDAQAQAALDYMLSRVDSRAMAGDSRRP
ncbi:MAG: cytochrome c5 family protein [Nitrosomonadales bacterium]|nr:cytochrome c5 family protein [Nitrosomonadales bacterium]